MIDDRSEQYLTPPKIISNTSRSFLIRDILFQHAKLEKTLLLGSHYKVVCLLLLRTTMIMWMITLYFEEGALILNMMCPSKLSKTDTSGQDIIIM